MYFPAGHLTIQNLNSNYRIHWEKNGQKVSMDLDLVNILTNLIDSHINRIKHFIRIMESDNPDALLDDQQAMEVILNIPDSDIIPGGQLNNKQIKIWHRQQLLIGYNRTHQVDMPWSTLQPHLDD